MSIAWKSKVIFSINLYKEDSVKSIERSRRGCGEKGLIEGENTSRPENWKDFLANDERLRVKKILVVCEGKTYSLASDSEAVTMLQVFFFFTAEGSSRAQKKRL